MREYISIALNHQVFVTAPLGNKYTQESRCLLLQVLAHTLGAAALRSPSDFVSHHFLVTTWEKLPELPSSEQGATVSQLTSHLIYELWFLHL